MLCNILDIIYLKVMFTYIWSLKKIRANDAFHLNATRQGTVTQRIKSINPF